MKTKYALHPKEYKIGQTEKFYTDMAAKGWHLEKRGAWLSKFDCGEPLDMKYRIEVYSGDDVPMVGLPEEQLAVYEDCGWEFVSKSGLINVFRAPADSDTEEFYLDPARQADTLKSLRKNMFALAIQLPFTLLILTLLNFMTGVNIFAQLYLALMAETWSMLGLIIVILAFCSNGISGAFHLTRLYKKMKKGIPLDHSPKQQSILPSAIKYGVMVLGILLVVKSYMFSAVPMPAKSDGMYATFSELGIDAPRDKNYFDRESEVIYRETPFCQYWDTFEVLEKSSTWMYQDVYLLKDEKYVQSTARSLMNTATFAKDETIFEEMHFDNLDKVYYNNDLELIVIKGNYVGYFTSIFTQESRNALLAVLSEKWL